MFTKLRLSDVDSLYFMKNNLCQRQVDSFLSEKDTSLKGIKRVLQFLEQINFHLKKTSKPYRFRLPTADELARVGHDQISLSEQESLVTYQSGATLYFGQKINSEAKPESEITPLLAKAATFRLVLYFIGH